MEVEGFRVEGARVGIEVEGARVEMDVEDARVGTAVVGAVGVFVRL